MGFGVIPSLNKAMSRCFKEDVAKPLQQWMGLLADALNCVKQLEKFRKLGQDTAARLATDSKGNALSTLVKQYETFHSAHMQARKSIDAISNEDEDKIRFVALGIQDLPVFKIADDAIAALSATADAFKEQANDLTEKLSEMTHDKHLPENSWKHGLDENSPFRDVQTAASMHLDNDVSGLDKLLKDLIEAGTHAAVEASSVSSRPWVEPPYVFLIVLERSVSCFDRMRMSQSDIERFDFSDYNRLEGFRIPFLGVFVGYTPSSKQFRSHVPSGSQ